MFSNSQPNCFKNDLLMLFKNMDAIYRAEQRSKKKAEEDASKKLIPNINVYELSAPFEERRKNILRKIKDINFSKLPPLMLTRGSKAITFVYFDEQLTNSNKQMDRRGIIIKIDPQYCLTINTKLLDENLYLLTLYNEIFLTSERSKFITPFSPRLVSGQWVYIKKNQRFSVNNRDVQEAYILLIHIKTIKLSFLKMCKYMELPQ